MTSIVWSIGASISRCRPFAEKYAADQDAFFVDYALAHKKLSEQGAQW